MPESLTPKKSFVKTFFGILTIVILVLLGLGLLSFSGLFGYYLWAQKFASSDLQKKLSEQYNPSFSKAPGLAGKATQTDKNVTAFIRPNNPTIGGTEQAPITIVAFIDFECPYSKKSYPIFDQILKKYGGTVRVVFKNFPITAIHQNAMPAALAGACAQEQNKFWPYYNSIFTVPLMSAEVIEFEATKLKLDSEKFSTCIQNQKYNKEITEDVQDGVALGVQGTPTYFVNQQKVEGVLDIAGWDQILIQEIQKKK